MAAAFETPMAGSAMAAFGVATAAFGVPRPRTKAPDVITASEVNDKMPAGERLGRYTEASWGKVPRRAQVKIWRRLEEARLARREGERRAWAVLEEKARVARLGLEPVAGACHR